MDAPVTSVDFHFDIMCPWAFQASLWMREVRDRLGLEVRWRFFSLEEINRAEGKKHPWQREHPRPGLQLPRPSQRAGKVREQSGDDLRCHHPVASNQTMLQLLLLHPVTRMMQQMQQKSAATRRDATPARSSG